jgi:thioredoxin-related protein
MLKLLIFTFLVSTSLSADFDWADSYQEALALAKKENKKVLVMFSQEGCLTCIKMKKEVYPDPNVTEYVNAFFVPVEIDIKRDSKEGYQVFGTPTYYFLDSGGKQIGRMMVGGADAKNFLKKLQEVEHAEK